MRLVRTARQLIVKGVTFPGFPNSEDQLYIYCDETVHAGDAYSCCSAVAS